MQSNRPIPPTQGRGQHAHKTWQQTEARGLWLHLGSFSQCVQCDDVTMRRLPHKRYRYVNVPRLPPKVPRHPGGYRDQAPHQNQPSAVSAMPATQKVCRRHQAPCLPRDEARPVPQVPRLPHKRYVDVTPKCHSCHAKCYGASKGDQAPPEPGIAIGAMRAKEKVRRCHQVPHLCKVPRRPGRPSTRYVNVTKWCHSCDAKCRATNATRASPVP